jgi:tRNA (guanosine-2'-O-)-methyltransferase
MGKRRKGADRAPVHEEELPPGTPEGERRAARMRLVAGRRLSGLTVVLDGVHDPHNISAVLRSAEGFGLTSAHLIGQAMELPPNRAITRGCEKWLELHYYDDPDACADALETRGFALFAAVPDRAAPCLEELDFGKKIAFVFGAERDGISERLLERSPGRYQIPMPGFSQSLNVSVAAAISIHVGATARRRLLGSDTDLAESEVRALADRWISRDEARRFSPR